MITLDSRQITQAAATTMIGNQTDIAFNSLITNIDAQMQKIYSSNNEYLCDGGSITFSGGVVTFTEDLFLVFTQGIGSSPSTPQTINLTNGTLTYTIPNGSSLVATVNRTLGQASLSVVSSINPANYANQDMFVIAYRKDSADSTITMYVRNGMAIADGQTVRLGAGSGSGGGVTPWPVTSVYVDGNRTDTYTPDGSIYKPYKDIQIAIQTILLNASSSLNLNIQISNCTYNVINLDLIINLSALISLSLFAPNGAIINGIQSTINNGSLISIFVNNCTILPIPSTSNSINFMATSGNNFLSSSGANISSFVNCSFTSNIIVTGSNPTVLSIKFANCFGSPTNISLSSLSFVSIYNSLFHNLTSDSESSFVCYFSKVNNITNYNQISLYNCYVGGTVSSNFNGAIIQNYGSFFQHGSPTMPLGVIFNYSYIDTTYFNPTALDNLTLGTKNTKIPTSSVVTSAIAAYQPTITNLSSVLDTSTTFPTSGGLDTLIPTSLAVVNYTSSRLLSYVTATTLNNYSLAALNDSTLGGGSPSTTVPPTQAAVQSYVLAHSGGGSSSNDSTLGGTSPSTTIAPTQSAVQVFVGSSNESNDSSFNGGIASNRIRPTQSAVKYYVLAHGGANVSYVLQPSDGVTYTLPTNSTIIAGTTVIITNPFNYAVTIKSYSGDFVDCLLGKGYVKYVAVNTNPVYPSDWQDIDHNHTLFSSYLQNSDWTTWNASATPNPRYVAGPTTSAYVYRGGVLAPNGKVVCIPYSATAPIAVYDPINNTIDNSTTTNAIPYCSGVLSPDGRVIFIPSNPNATIGRYDPYAVTKFSIGATALGTATYLSGVLANTGNIIFIPNSASSKIGIYNPLTNVWTLSSQSTGAYSYLGGVLLPDGTILFVPATAAAPIGIYNPSTDSYTSYASTTGLTTYRGGVLAPNGKVVLIPAPGSGFQLGIYDTTTQQFSLNSTVLTTEGYSAGVLSPNGKIILIPANTVTPIGIYDPVTDVLTNGPSPSEAFWGAVLAPNGKIVCIPNAASTSIGLYDTMQPVPLNIALSPWFNKF
jgi:hypothetical protein